MTGLAVEGHDGRRGVGHSVIETGQNVAAVSSGSDVEHALAILRQCANETFVGGNGRGHTGEIQSRCDHSAFGQESAVGNFIYLLLSFLDRFFIHVQPHMRMGR